MNKWAEEEEDEEESEKKKWKKGGVRKKKEIPKEKEIEKEIEKDVIFREETVIKGGKKVKIIKKIKIFKYQVFKSKMAFEREANLRKRGFGMAELDPDELSNEIEAGPLKKTIIFRKHARHHKEPDISEKLANLRVGRDKAEDELEQLEKKIQAIENPQEEKLKNTNIMDIKFDDNNRRYRDYFTVRVTNIPQDATEDELHRIFRKFGRIMNLNWPKVFSKSPNWATEERPRRSFAFVGYLTEEEAKKAIKEGKDESLGYTLLNVQMSKPKSRDNRNRDGERVRDFRPSHF